MHFKVTRYLADGSKQGDYLIKAPTIEDACALEGHKMGPTEQAVYMSIARTEGRARTGTCFIQQFTDCLPENRIQYVFIDPYWESPGTGTLEEQ